MTYDKLTKKKRIPWNKGLAGYRKFKMSEDHKAKIAASLKGNKNGKKEIKQTIEEKRVVAKELRLRNKLKVIQVYSNGTLDCACCGEDCFTKLTIDHINGNGTNHRLNVLGHKSAGSGFYLWLIRNGYPDGYQVLCETCNKSKGNRAFCKIHNKQLM